MVRSKLPPVVVGALTTSVPIWSGVVQFLSGLTGAQATLIQTVVLAFGGVWALILYRRHRQGQTTIRLGLSAAITGAGADRRLLVRTSISNAAAVLAKNVEATLTLFELTQRETGAPFTTLLRREADPLVPINGEIKALPQASDVEGNPEQPVAFDDDVDDPDLEPGERLECEIAFPMPPPKDGELWALRFKVDADQWSPWPFRFSRAYSWGTFALVDPGLVSGHYEALGHPTD
jgi:hypothetical protein